MFIIKANQTKLKSKGYGLEVWTLNEPDDLIDTWNFRPDFIETDNSDFKDIANNKK